MSRQFIKGKVYIADDKLREMIGLFDYIAQNTDNKIKEAVKPIMLDAKRLAASEVRKGVRNPHSRYSWKLYKNGVSLRKNGRYAKALVLRDHSKQSDVFYEITGAKKEYRLTHLLEFSHNVRPWGNKHAPMKKTKAVPHIATAQALVDEKATKACRKVVEKLFG